MQLEPFKLEAGDRVRCVNSQGFHYLTDGSEYVVRAVNETHVQFNAYGSWYHADRFKPVVRVKARSVRYFSAALRA